MKISIDKVDQNNFISFVNRLKVIDTFIYFKIKDDVVQASAYLPQRDAVKHHRVPVEHLFQLADGTMDAAGSKEFKIAFFDASRLTDAFKQFEFGNIKAEIEFVENEEDFVATSFRVYNDELEIKLACSEPSLGYKDLTDSQIESIFNVDAARYAFDMDYTAISKVRSLFGLDKEETFSISTHKDGVRMKGKTYNYLVTDGFEGKNTQDVTLFKKYLALLDKEDYSANVMENRVVLRSKDSETLLTIATCQTAE
jgi:hypothetical protein